MRKNRSAYILTCQTFSAQTNNIMKTKPELEQDIIKMTSTIQQDFPELHKYTSEIPIKGLENDELTVQNLEEYYLSLKELVNEYAKTHKPKKDQKELDSSPYPGYPIYPSSDDIYQRDEKVMSLNPENLSKRKTRNEKGSSMNEKDFEDDKSGDDLDVPGSELDNQQESVGSEDEENNYYSLGGDNHDDLEEDRS
ncbi:MAG: hypothetical protein ACJA1O_002979 [Spirosomataceae bacterium]|jgi:hypothetical protein